MVFTFLIIVSAYAVFKLAVQLREGRKCIKEKEIIGYVNKDITDERRRAVRAHIIRCAKCEELFLDHSLRRKDTH